MKKNKRERDNERERERVGFLTGFDGCKCDRVKVSNHTWSCVTDGQVTKGDTLQAELTGAGQVNGSQEHHLLLSCGTVQDLWASSVSVSWKVSKDMHYMY